MHARYPAIAAFAVATTFGLSELAHATSGGSGVVSAWQVGGLKIGVATEADVVAFAGAPDRTREDDNDYTGEEGVVLGYGCSASGRCKTDYGINRSSDTLVNFATRSKSFRTFRGTRVGQSRKRAERREGRKARGSCIGYTITRTRDGRSMSVVVNNRWVTQLTSTGPGGGPFFSC